MKISCREMISDGHIYEKCIIDIENDVISAVKYDADIRDFDYDRVSPALVDLHINGGEEYHFTAHPTVEALYDIEHSAILNGTAYTLPTIITSPPEILMKADQALTEYYKIYPQSGILGIHFEGPFISQKKRGAHLSQYILTPTEENLFNLSQLNHNKLLTIAIENFSESQINDLLRSDTTISIGHSDATYEEAQNGFEKGIHTVTHLYNAMSSFSHRAPGLVGASLINDNVYCPIILDGLHLSKEAAQLAWKIKGEKLFLISDALFQNHKKKEFKWGEFDAHYRDTTYYNSEGNLAGASISLWDAVLNAMDWFDIPLERALKLATSIPASIIKHHRKIGKIESGYEARLIAIVGNDIKPELFIRKSISV